MFDFLKRLKSGRSGLSASVSAASSDLPVAGNCIGFVEQFSARHAQGWIRDLDHPTRRVGYQIVLPDTGEILLQGQADQFGHGLASAGYGDGIHAFWVRLPRSLNDREQEQAIFRIDTGQTLPWLDDTKRAYEPLLHVSMDIVDNCNLRCPFCLYDYANTRATHFMSEETLDAALRFLPFTRDGEFWFSCLHEPSLHPDLVRFIERVPTQYRRKLFYTTNLAKRMPASYFEWLAGSLMHHVNISIESRDPALYERMRKGARHAIFQENWDLLMSALDRSQTPTPIRYVTMAYKSNLHELPELVRYLLEERRGSQVEIRYTFDVPFIAADFRAREFLEKADWDWLEQQLAAHTSGQVQLLRPPPPPPPPAPSQDQVPSSAALPAKTGAPSPEGVLPGRAMFRLSWDGSLKIVGISAASRDDHFVETTIENTNIRAIAEPESFLDRLLGQVAV